MLAQAAAAFNHASVGVLRWLFLFLLIALPGCTRDEIPRLSWAIPISPQTRTVLLESWRAPDARVIRTGSSKEVIISARPVLQPLSQHGPEPDWHDKPAEEWPFQWELYQASAMLKLRSQGETLFPHRRYILEDVTITVGEGVAVECRKTTLERGQ